MKLQSGDGKLSEKSGYGRKRLTFFKGKYEPMSSSGLPVMTKGSRKSPRVTNKRPAHTALCTFWCTFWCTNKMLCMAPKHVWKNKIIKERFNQK